MNTSVFEKITISKNDFTAAERNSFEISLDHKLYDIKSKNIIGDSIYLLVLNDTKEQEIEAQIEVYFDEDENLNKGRSDKAKQIKKLFELQYLCPAQSELFLTNNRENISYAQQKEEVMISTLRIITPPPRKA
jgi:hypothetical protein